MICRDLRVCITDLEDEEFNKIDGELVILIESKCRWREKRRDNGNSLSAQ